MLLYIYALSLLALYICCFTGRWKEVGAAGGMDEVGWRLEGSAKVLSLKLLVYAVYEALSY
jgi:hypothetical protein